MKRIRKLTTAFLVIALLVTSLVSVPALAADEGYVKVERLAGASRYLTAVEVSKEAYKEAETVIIAAGANLNFPDALAASALAGKLEAPVLLAEKDGFRAGTLEEIKRLGAKKAIVLGGELALEKEVDALLEAAGLTVRRIAGENRYETAALVAAEVIGTGKHVFLVNGDSPWDALAIGPVAAAEGIPVLLTKAGALRDETKAFLVDNGIKTVTILGGEKAVSAAARAQIPASIAVKRVFGENRDETSLDVAEEFFGDLDTVVIASRASFADALVGGYFAALVDAPILLVGDKKINDWIDEYLLGQEDIEDIYILGGEAVISKAMAEELDGYDVIKSIEPIPNQVLEPGTGQLKFLVNGKWTMNATTLGTMFPDYALTFLYTPGSVPMTTPATGAAGSSMGKGKYAVSVTETATGVKVPAEGALAENAVEYVVSNPKAIAKVTKFVMTWGGLPNVVGKVAAGDPVNTLTPVAIEAVTVGGTTVTQADTSLYTAPWPTFAGWVGSTFPEVIEIDASSPAIKNPGGSTTLSFTFDAPSDLQRWSVYVEKAERVATSVANKNYSVFTYDTKTFDLSGATSPDKIVLLDQYGEPIDANGQYVKITNKAKAEMFPAAAISTATGLVFMNVADTFTVTVYPGNPTIPANSKPLGSYTIKTVPQGNAVPKIELDFVPEALGEPLYKELVLNGLPTPGYVKFDVVDELHVGINVTVNGLPISAADVEHVVGVADVNFTIESSDTNVATVAPVGSSLYAPIKVTAAVGTSAKAGATTLTLKGTASGQTSTLAMLTVKAKDVTPKINELEIVTRKLEVSGAVSAASIADQLFSPDLAKYTTYGFGEVDADLIYSASLYSGGDYLFVRIVMNKAYGGKTFEIRARLVEGTPE